MQLNYHQHLADTDLSLRNECYLHFLNVILILLVSLDVEVRVGVLALLLGLLGAAGSGAQRGGGAFPFLVTLLYRVRVPLREAELEHRVEELLR